MIIQSYNLGDSKPSYLLTDMISHVESYLYLQTRKRIKIVIDPNDVRQLTLLGRAFDSINSPLFNLYFTP